MNLIKDPATVVLLALGAIIVEGEMDNTCSGVLRSINASVSLSFKEPRGRTKRGLELDRTIITYAT